MCDVDLEDSNVGTFDKLLEHIKCKLKDGNGETFFEIGNQDDAETKLNEDELAKICSKLNADYIEINDYNVKNLKDENKVFLIRQRVEIDDFNEIRIAVVGNVDAGKSTLLGVLTLGNLDDGRGLARQKVFRHKHEVETGRTSSVSKDLLMGFDSKGKLINQPISHFNNQIWGQICEKSSKVISFIDLAGHEKYLKTTVFGITGLMPNFCMLTIGANAGVIGTTKEHLGLCLALNVPVFVVITKIDLCPPNVLQKTIQLLQKVLKSNGCRKVPLMINSQNDLYVAAKNFSSEKLCPIFQVSNVTGKNLDLLKIFLNLLIPKSKPNLNQEPKEFQIDGVFTVPGVGTVVSGLVIKGIIKTNDVLLMGPNFNSKFEPVIIKSIHRKRMPVKEVCSGKSASFALKKMKKNEIRKGMVLLENSLEPKAYWEFYAEILVFHHPTTICKNYQAMIHCGAIKQTAYIISMNKDFLRTGDRAKVHMKFVKNPEYIYTGQRLVLREGKTKAIGCILSVVVGFPPPHLTGAQSKKKKRFRRDPESETKNESILTE